MKRIKQFISKHSTALVAFFVGVAFGCFLTTALTEHAIERHTAKQDYQSVLEYVSDTFPTRQNN